MFLYRGHPIETKFDKAMQVACEKAGILYGREVKGGFVFHDLRHTFITEMRRAGVDRMVTMAITGHQMNDMNARYDTVEDSEKLEAVRRLEEYRSATVPHLVPQEEGKDR